MKAKQAKEILKHFNKLEENFSDNTASLDYFNYLMPEKDNEGNEYIVAYPFFSFKDDEKNLRIELFVKCENVTLKQIREMVDFIHFDVYIGKLDEDFTGVNPVKISANSLDSLKDKFLKFLLEYKC